MLKTSRRGFLGAILAIPLAGWTGFRAVMRSKPLYFPPIAQDHVSYLMNAHMANVKRQIALQFSADLERAYLGLEEINGVHETPRTDSEATH
jgi:hypothetical protein